VIHEEARKEMKAEEKDSSELRDEEVIAYFSPVWIWLPL
jgi:hypothetical protein